MLHLSRPAQRWARSLLWDLSSPASCAPPTAFSFAKSGNDLFKISKGKRGGSRICLQREISTCNLSLLAKRRGGFGGADGEDDKDKDDDDEEDAKPKRKGKREMPVVNREDVEGKPMEYYFAGVPPDLKAPCLSSASKEKIWQAYRDNPVPNMIDKLAETYKIRKQRVHAILWLKDIEKEEVAKRGKPLDDEIEKGFEQIFGSYDTADNERHYTIPSTKPDFVVMPEGWQGTIKAEGQSTDEVSAREEKMLVEEFEQRMAFNKLQIAGVIKTNKLDRRRPPEGWSYLVEELGEEGKRGRKGGRCFIAQPDGSHRGLNELEKMFLKRESVRPRRRLTPK